MQQTIECVEEGTTKDLYQNLLAVQKFLGSKISRWLKTDNETITQNNLCIAINNF